jgi:hypothetical protein
MQDHFAHLVKQAAAQQVGGEAFFRYGHIATYDPATHRIRAIVPAWRDENGNPVMTGRVPLACPWVGAGWGMQLAPPGSAAHRRGWSRR